MKHPPTTRRPFQRLHTAMRIARAFTLIEMLIAVGAVALIAVGLSKLFASTGETIKAGRRISALSEAANTLERQIRKDIDAIANGGDGFMVIRNKRLYENGVEGRGIRLSNDDRNPAPGVRRVDEFMFFAHGSYTSAREPQYPGRTAVGAAARIYYGHGMRLDSYEDLTIHSDPMWHDTTSPRIWQGAGTGGLGENGPNRFAGTWTLLRHVTVLARPQRTANSGPGAVFPGLLDATRWPDSIVQIGLQPAAASIFRVDPIRLTAPDILGWGYKDPPSGAGGPTAFQLTLPRTREIARPGETSDWPSFVNGMVDVAAVDLNLIRARVIGVGRDPQASNQGNLLPSDLYFEQGYTLPLISQPTPKAMITSTQVLDNTVHGQKMTMAGAMPSNDPWLFDRGTLATPDQGRSGNQATAYNEQRVIYAPAPPDFTGNLNPAHLGTPYPANEPYHRQDQAMLSSSVITPGCTEFIVEWSFGDVHAAPLNQTLTPGDGGIIWHGLTRDDGTPYGVHPYRAVSAFPATGAVVDEHFNGVNRAVPAALIHWPIQQNPTGTHPTDVAGQRQMPLYSFFGYQDPSYIPQDATRDPSTLDWPWPRLLRFTYTLTDPSNPAVEQTYQFVVQVPSQQRKPS